jgi:hypothetical protein
MVFILGNHCNTYLRYLFERGLRPTHTMDLDLKTETRCERDESATGNPIDGLADQVGVASMTGPFFNEVDVDRSERHLLSVHIHDVIKRQILYRSVAPCPLSGKVGDRLRSTRWVEIVEVFVGGRKEGSDVFPCSTYSKPRSFDLCHVPNQTL